MKTLYTMLRGNGFGRQREIERGGRGMEFAGRWLPEKEWTVDMIKEYLDLYLKIKATSNWNKSTVEELAQEIANQIDIVGENWQIASRELTERLERAKVQFLREYSEESA